MTKEHRNAAELMVETISQAALAEIAGGQVPVREWYPYRTGQYDKNGAVEGGACILRANNFDRNGAIEGGNRKDDTDVAVTSGMGSVVTTDFVSPCALLPGSLLGSHGSGSRARRR